MPEKDEKKKKDIKTDEKGYEVIDKLTVKLGDIFKSLGSSEGKSPNELFRIKNKLKI